MQPTSISSYSLIEPVLLGCLTPPVAALHYKGGAGYLTQRACGLQSQKYLLSGPLPKSFVSLGLEQSSQRTLMAASSVWWWHALAHGRTLMRAFNVRRSLCQFSSYFSVPDMDFESQGIFFFKWEKFDRQLEYFGLETSPQFNKTQWSDSLGKCHAALENMWVIFKDFWYWFLT